MTALALAVSPAPASMLVIAAAWARDYYRRWLDSRPVPYVGSHRVMPGRLATVARGRGWAS